ncbi:hypothetical protein OG728_38805 (plasmid) [Streptomyces microflavus]|uniref:hypothetical protein n=1 Tax=Streptomyces microflavus TaxID=1919 RepID=UPI002E0F723B|nr:hypothetical protein OG728_38805 [Streptomyces microflavus]
MSLSVRPSPNRPSLDDPLPVRICHRLATGGYRPGQALPTGLIAHYLRTTPAAVKAALAELAERGDVEYRGAGEHGPAYYLPGGRR